MPHLVRSGRWLAPLLLLPLAATACERPGAPVSLADARHAVQAG